MKLNYEQIAAQARRLGACNAATSELLNSVTEENYDKAKWIIVDHVGWLQNHPDMSRVLPKKMWDVITKMDCSSMECIWKARRALMRLMNLKQRVIMRLSYPIVSDVTVLSKDNVWYLDAYCDTDDTAYIIIKDLITGKKYPTIDELPMSKMADAEYIIETCLNHLKETSNATKL